MRLYAKNEKNKIEEVFNVNASNKKNILYMIQNSKMMSQMLEYINKNKSINLIKKKMVSEIISKGLLKTVDGSLPPKDVYQEVKKIVEEFKE